MRPRGWSFRWCFWRAWRRACFRTRARLTDPTGLEEERRLCYVGMTRAMDTLVMTRARYRRRYGNDMPEASVPSRFLEEVPARLVEDLGSPPARPQFSAAPAYGRVCDAVSAARNRAGGEAATKTGERHYSYEDEDQSGTGGSGRAQPGAASGCSRKPAAAGGLARQHRQLLCGARAPPAKVPRPKLDIPDATGKTGLSKGSRVRHPKYGEGTVFRREGDGDDAKITVQFQQHGVKKLVEKFAQLEAPLST